MKSLQQIKQEAVEKFDKLFSYRISEHVDETISPLTIPNMDLRRVLKAFVDERLDLAVREANNLTKLILPMAKGYAREHPVGSNQRIVIQVEEAIRAGKN